MPPTATGRWPKTARASSITGTEAWQCETACVDGSSLRGRIDKNLVAWIYADHGADREYRDCPLKHVNPKGWVDAYRQPKYLYYLWQAHYAPYLMAFAQPHWWRREYLGESHDFEVYSNGEEVRLYIDDAFFSSAQPKAEEFYTVTFRDVPVSDAVLRIVARRGTETYEHRLPMTGEPATLKLTPSHTQVTADCTGIVLMTVEVLDAHGQAVAGAHPTLTWEIAGPGRLLAPAVFTSDIYQREADEGTMYTTTPVVMPVRTTNVFGAVRVTVSTPGLPSAQVAVESVAAAVRSEDGIEELAAPDGNLQRRERQQQEGQVRREDTASPVRIIHTDLQFGSCSRAEIEQRLRGLIGTDTMAHHTNAVRELIDSLTSIAEDGGGVLIADDFNFHVTQFNRQLSS